MNKRWMMIAVVALAMSLVLTPVARASECPPVYDADFTVDCTGVSTSGWVPDGSTFILGVLLHDGPPTWNTVYQDSRTVVGPAPFELQVPWPLNPNGLEYKVVIVADGQAIKVVEGPPFDCAEGCTPGGWQGGNLRDRWNVPFDPDFNPPGGNLFGHNTQFNGFFTQWPSLDTLTMWDLVSKGGGKDDARKAARSLVAAYLNASHNDVNYPKTTIELEAMWDSAVADGAFLDLHKELDEYNNYGCQIE